VGINDIYHTPPKAWGERRLARLASCYEQKPTNGDYYCYDATANATFIAHAHQDIPALLETIEELERQLTAAQQGTATDQNSVRNVA
jgi:hypothetical protein